MPSFEIITPEPSGSTPIGDPNPGFLYPGQIGSTDTTEGDAISQVLVKSAYTGDDIKISKNNLKIKILLIPLKNISDKYSFYINNFIIEVAS